jgi:hypothetical protein
MALMPGKVSRPVGVRYISHDAENGVLCSFFSERVANKSVYTPTAGFTALRCLRGKVLASRTETVQEAVMRYRYYVCSQAQKRGWKTCPAPSVPAGEIERLVGEQIQRLRAGSGDKASASWWETLPALAQIRVVQRLVERIDYDGIQGTLAITFAGDAAQALVEEHALMRQETKA